MRLEVEMYTLKLLWC